MTALPWAGLAADALLVVHALFIAWAALGALAVWRWPRLAGLHLPAAAWAVWIEGSGGICPLTSLEVQWRQAAGQAGYTGGFVEHYLMAAIYPQGLTRQVQWLLGGAVLLFNAGWYAALWARLARRRRRPQDTRADPDPARRAARRQRLG
jgi:hypothetical protein